MAPRETDGRGAVSVPGATPPPPSGAPKAILLAEDDASVRKLICKTLTSLGYEVLDTARTDDALLLAAMSSRSIDLLITASLMEQPLSGANLAIELAQFQPNLKVLFISGYANAERKEPIRLERGQSYLQKPFRMAELTQRVREMFGEPSENAVSE